MRIKQVRGIAGQVVVAPPRSLDHPQADRPDVLGEIGQNTRPRCGGFSPRRRRQGLTWHNPNTVVLVEGPEIAIKPVDTRLRSRR